MNKYGFLSVTEFADRHQISRQAVIKAIKARRIFAFRVGKIWVIGNSEFEKSTNKVKCFNRFCSGDKWCGVGR